MQISKKDFLAGIRQMESAYNYVMPEEQFEAYYRRLKDLFTNEGFSQAVERVIMAENRFPAISTLAKYKTKRGLVL